MTEHQYYELISLAKAQLRVTELESHWSLYVEGVTDIAYALRDYDTMTRLDTRLWLMWNAKRYEGME